MIQLNELYGRINSAFCARIVAMLSDSCLIGNFIKHVFQFFAESLTKECISTDPIQCSDWENELGLAAELTLADRTDISIHVQLRLKNLLYSED